MLSSSPLSSKSFTCSRWAHCPVNMYQAGGRQCCTNDPKIRCLGRPGCNRKTCSFGRLGWGGVLSLYGRLENKGHLKALGITIGCWWEEISPALFWTTWHRRTELWFVVTAENKMLLQLCPPKNLAWSQRIPTSAHWAPAVGASRTAWLLLHRERQEQAGIISWGDMLIPAESDSSHETSPLGSLSKPSFWLLFKTNPAGHSGKYSGCLGGRGGKIGWKSAWGT